MKRRVSVALGSGLRSYGSCKDLRPGCDGGHHDRVTLAAQCWWLTQRCLATRAADTQWSRAVAVEWQWQWQWRCLVVVTAVVADGRCATWQEEARCGAGGCGSTSGWRPGWG